jgi:hypothetical protein
MRNKTNAGVVTKALKANGFTRAEWNKVGVSTYNDGFITERVYNFNDAVAVTWLFAGYHRDITADEMAIAKQHLAEMAIALNKRGYETKIMGENEPWLLVSKSA